MSLLARCGRIVTPGRRLIPQIDGLRFVAISTVFYYLGMGGRGAVQLT
jgi:hypothetical protein